MTACPVHTNACGYIRAIAEGDYERSFDIARLPNPFAYVCGRICAHPCESACRRGRIDQPIAIRALKRAATDRHSGPPCSRYMPPPEMPGWRGRKVAVIGAGPTGLSCAHDLAYLGYRVTVFEASPVAGGMLRLGVPEYRLPRSTLQAEINFIQDLGVEIHLNTPVGPPDLTIEKLRRDGFEAFYIGVGTQKGRQLNIPGVDFDGVIRAIDYLININLGYRLALGSRVVVIGGGNVAFDVARTVLRDEAGALIEDEIGTDVVAALDVARAARSLGAREVHLVCLESLAEMPADQEEIEEGQREGIVLHTSLGPKRILGMDGRVAGAEFVRCTSVFDSEGRFKPTFDERHKEVIGADTVMTAIGQAVDLSFLSGDEGIHISPRGLITVDSNSLQTSAEDVFAGGDAAFGPRIAIEAVANGRVAASSIHGYLLKEPAKKPIGLLTNIGEYRRLEGYDRLSRMRVPTIDLNRRVGFTEVETGYSAEEAESEASRCLQCDLNVVINGELCVLCGGCVDICPYDCLQIVSLDRVEPEPDAALDVAQRLGYSSFEELKRDGLESVEAKLMLKDEDKCIRCALCVERCPVDAITLQRFIPEEMSVAL